MNENARLYTNYTPHVRNTILQVVRETIGDEAYYAWMKEVRQSHFEQLMLSEKVKELQLEETVRERLANPLPPPPSNIEQYLETDESIKRRMQYTLNAIIAAQSHMPNPYQRFVVSRNLQSHPYPDPHIAPNASYAASVHSHAVGRAYGSWNRALEELAVIVRKAMREGKEMPYLQEEHRTPLNEVMRWWRNR